MRLAILIVGVMLSWSSQASCREIRATSGEHSDFSRIVLFFENQSGWSFKRTSSGYSLEYSGEIASLDISEVFKFIPKTRVLGLEHAERENVINFSVECECHADAFEIHNGHIAIDFKEGIDPNQVLVSENTTPEPILDINTPSTTFPAPGGFSLESTNRNTNLHNFLASSLVDAMNDGLVQPAEVIVETPRQHNQFGDNSLLENISIGLDFRRAVEQEGGGALNTSVDDCADGERFAFPEVATGSINDISEMRRDLFNGNFDLASDEVRKLSDYYFSLGFGAEALALLLDEGSDLPRDARMVSIGRVLENADIGSITGFEKSISCENPLSLWGLIIHGNVSGMTDASMKAMLRTLAGMSQGLRNAIAPLVLENTSAYNSLQFESELMHVLELDISGPVSGQSGHLAQLSESRLDELRRENTDVGNNATLELANRYLAAKKNVSADFLRDIESRAFELRGSSAGDSFATSFLKLAAMNGAAFEALSFLEGVDSDQYQAPDQVTDAVIESLIGDSNDERFVLNSLNFKELLFSLNFSKDLMPRMVRRLAEAGLPSLASEFSSNLTGDEDDRVNLQAELLLLENRSQEALTIFAESDRAISYPLIVESDIPTDPMETIRSQAVANLDDEDAQRVLWHLSDNQLNEGEATSRYSNKVARLQIASTADHLLENLAEFTTLDEFSDVADYSAQQLTSVEELLNQFSLSE